MGRWGTCEGDIRRWGEGEHVRETSGDGEMGNMGGRHQEMGRRGTCEGDISRWGDGEHVRETSVDGEKGNM